MFNRMVNTAAFNRKIELAANNGTPLIFEDGSAARVERIDDEEPIKGTEEDKVYVPATALRIYVCSPYRGDIEQNVENAKKYCRYILLQGMIPIAPHLYLPQFMSEEKERDSALEINRSFMHACDEIWVFADSYEQATEGMKWEINYWKDMKLECVNYIYNWRQIIDTIKG